MDAQHHQRTGQAKPREQDIALVYGAGPMGLTTIQVLKRVYKVTFAAMVKGSTITA
jgi:threonine dehydrogenase-like Zn-dependent dehydrogenase